MLSNRRMVLENTSASQLVLKYELQVICTADSKFCQKEMYGTPPVRLLILCATFNSSSFRTTADSLSPIICTSHQVCYVVSSPMTVFLAFASGFRAPPSC